MAQVFRLGVQAFQGLKSAFKPTTSSSTPSHNPYKLLLIGETGSGKTSFLNLLCNFEVVSKLGFGKISEL